MRGSDGFDRASPIASLSGTSLDWQKPRAPVRFPLRDALLSFQDTTRSPSVQEAEGGASTLDSKGPLMVRMTQKAKLHKYLSHRKRYDMDPPALGEKHASQMPRPPPQGMLPARKTLNTYGTEMKVQARRRSENVGQGTWMAHAPPPPPQEEPVAENQAIRGTLTSSARAVLSHSRRFAVESLAQNAVQSGHGGTHGGGKKLVHEDPCKAWSPVRQCKGLPRPVKEWVCRGLEFTDAGLGIGDRFDTNIEQMASRAPGHIYDQDFGNIARWKSEASIPTKQPDGRFTSAETHKMGARRDRETKRDRQRPGPGTYEFRGFAQELTYKLSKRPKGEPPRTLSPPGSSKGSRMLQASQSSA